MKRPMGGYPSCGLVILAALMALSGCATGAGSPGEDGPEARLLPVETKGTTETEDAGISDMAAMMDAATSATAEGEPTTTPLLLIYAAALQPDTTWLDRMLASGTDIDYLDPAFGVTAFHYAVGEGQLEAAQRLLDRGAKIETRSQPTGATPLIDAVNLDETETVRWLLERKADPNAMDTWVGVTPLVSATMDNRLEIMQLLLDHGADPNKANGQGVPPLHLAVSLGRLEAVELLLKSGADPNQETRDRGVTPLEVALRRPDWPDIIRELREAGAME